MKLSELRLRLKEAIAEQTGKPNAVTQRHWLSPTGKVISSPTTNRTSNDAWGEDKWAAAFLKKQGIQSEYPSEELKDKFGFAELAEADNGIYISLGKGRKLTNAQQREARDFAIERQKPLLDDMGREIQETITRAQLKEVIKATLRTILKEGFIDTPPAQVAEGQMSPDELQSTWEDDKQGEYIQINPDDSVVYVAHGSAMEQIAPKGSGRDMFRLIGSWMKAKQYFPNIWQVNDHGNVELYSKSGKPLGGLVEASKSSKRLPQNQAKEKAKYLKMAIENHKAIFHVDMSPKDVKKLEWLSAELLQAYCYKQVDDYTEREKQRARDEMRKDFDNFSKYGDKVSGEDDPNPFAETRAIKEMTVTGDVAPINLPGNVKGGWVSGKGGSARGLAGSKSLGYELTPIGKQEMSRKQDKVYEQ